MPLGEVSYKVVLIKSLRLPCSITDVNDDMAHLIGQRNGVIRPARGRLVGMRRKTAQYSEWPDAAHVIMDNA